jgi:hypothetical protein
MPSPPPLVVVGRITFYFECGVFGLVTSHCPIIPYLLQEDKTRATRVVRVIRVESNTYLPVVALCQYFGCGGK